MYYTITTKFKYFLNDPAMNYVMC